MQTLESYKNIDNANSVNIMSYSIEIRQRLCSNIIGTLDQNDNKYVLV